MKNYNKIIIVCYPAGAGGNFLINCLSLTSQCVLRDAVLAEQQLTSGFDTIKKLKYFNDKLEIAKKNNQWNDLDLGCSNLFGFDNLMYLTEYPEVFEKKFNFVISQLIKQDKYLFIVAHTMQMLEAYQKFWTNAQVIFFTEYRNFIQQRGYNQSTLNLEKNIYQYWSTVKGQDWPAMPPLTRSDFLKLPSTIQCDLKEIFHSEIFRYFDPTDLKDKLFDRDVNKHQNLLKNRAFIWNVAETYSGDASKFLTELYRCASWLNLKITADTQDIINYYNTWQETLWLINPTNKCN
jgi:hypothetical protein